MYFLNLILLAAIWIPGLGVESNGARRWLNLGITQLQPSDLTKILMILFFARFLSDRERSINNPKVILQGIALILPSLVMIYKQPNLSTTICVAALFCALLFLAGLSYKFVGTMLAVTVPTVVIFLAIAVQPNQPFLHDYQQERILAWLEPEKYADDESYQQLNSVMAIGSGQLSGKGYDNDDTTSVKNGNYVPEPQTDFIFAIIGEELGFVGCCVVIFLLLLIVIECIMVGLKAKDTGGTHHLRRRCRTDRDPEFYQYQCGYFDPSEYRIVAALCKLWTDFRCVLFYGDRFRIECRFAA